MISLGQYLEAATRPNTERAYAAATRHFEVEWGGHLPATAEQVARYLAAYAGQLALNTGTGSQHWPSGTRRTVSPTPRGRPSYARCSRASKRCIRVRKSEPRHCSSRS